MTAAVNNARSVNVFDSPGKKHINVFPRKSVLNQTASTGNSAANAARLRTVSDTPNGGKAAFELSRSVEMNLFPQLNQPHRSGGNPFNPMRFQKEAAMEKEAWLGVLAAGIRGAARMAPAAYRAARTFGGAGKAAGGAGRLSSARHAARRAFDEGISAGKKHLARVEDAAQYSADKATRAAQSVKSNPWTSNVAGSRTYRAKDWVRNTRPVQWARDGWNSNAMYYPRNLYRDSAGVIGRGYKNNLSLMGAMEGGFTGGGVDAAIGFGTGNDTDLGFYTGTALGALNPRLAKMWRAARGSKAMAGSAGAGGGLTGGKIMDKAQTAWQGQKLKDIPGDSTGFGTIARLVGGRRALQGASLHGMLGYGQQAMTADKVPGGINYARPVQTYQANQAIGKDVLAQKLGFRSGEELEQAMAMIRQAHTGQM